MPADKDYVDIGPECFGLADGSVLNWRGQNYTPQRTTLRAWLHNNVYVPFLDWRHRNP